MHDLARPGVSHGQVVERPVGSVADELIAAAAPSEPLDDRVSAPWSMADALADDAAREPSQAAIATLAAFLADEKGIAFAEVETPIAIVQTAINALRGQIPALAGTPDLEQTRAELFRAQEIVRVGREHSAALRVFLRDHFGIAPEKINTAPLLASAIINQFRAINSELVKAKRGGS